eukprot:103925-Alexandrium_andersonii.AAC.1
MIAPVRPAHRLNPSCADRSRRAHKRLQASAASTAQPPKRPQRRFDQRRTYTDKRIPGAANRLQQFAAFCS